MQDMLLSLRRTDGKKRDFFIRDCLRADLEAVFQLENAVYRGIRDKRLYGTPESREGISRILQGGRILGVFHKEELTGAAILIRDSQDPCHLYGDVQNKEKLPMPLYTYNAIFLREDCRGFGLQKELLKLLDDISLSEGAKAALASVSPYNQASRRNLLAAGFCFLENCRLYGGLEREILIKVFSSGILGKKQEDI